MSCHQEFHAGDCSSYPWRTLEQSLRLAPRVGRGDTVFVTPTAVSSLHEIAGKSTKTTGDFKLLIAFSIILLVWFGLVLSHPEKGEGPKSQMKS